jgi:GNAT superfamily N-acetyltransferase
MPLLFSYGTLQEEHVQLSTFGRLLLGHRDELPGFESSLVPIQDAELTAATGRTHHVNVTFNGRDDSCVSGAVFEITDAELAAADLYEQRASYKRVAAMLASGKHAWVYVDARSAMVTTGGTGTITVRRATRSDIPDLVELMHDFYAESSFPLDRAWAARAFADLLADPSRGAAWIIECDGVPIGHVVLSVRFTMEFGGLSACIDDLFVRPEHRRKGAASAGLDALVAECRSRGCRSIHVEVAPHNQAAISLYGRYGLVPGDDDRQQLRVVLPHGG